MRDIPARASATARPAGRVAGARRPSSRCDEAEKQLIIKALQGHDGNRTKAAQQLGISRRTLHRKLNEYGLRDEEESRTPS